MIIIFLNFFKIFAIIFLLNDYLSRHYKNEHNQFCIDILYYLMYVYSYTEYTFNKSIKYIKSNNPYIFELVYELTKIKPKILDIEFIKDNSLICSKSKNYYLSNIIEEIPKYDFIIYTETTYNQVYTKIIQYNSLLNLQDKNNFEYVKTTFNFLMVELIVGDKNYNIELQTNFFNFYIKDNILDKKFFLYYLRNIHEDKIKITNSFIETNEIIVKIIDQNVYLKIIDFTKNQYILLKENNYEITDKPF